MNHKLRVTVRVDIDPGHVTLLVTGCLTRSNYPVLLHIMRRARQLASGSFLQMDLTQSSHLDLEVLEYLRHLEGRETEANDRRDADDTRSAPPAFQLTLTEPAELPVCLVHAGVDGERMAGLDGEILSGLGSDDMLSISEAAFGAVSAISHVGDAKPAWEGGVNLSFYLEGTLEPASTVAAMSDESLAELADALYRHLDTRKPFFGAHTWYDFAADELQRRHAEGSATPPQDELAMG
ncbi:hypothetical protein [Arthrobacter sp.]|uniref:hypothetical protein n=1 Tax=Arthrobacter sp. TaxID=1667 RepID=UPI002811986A|nr:hypothetical protein [Arthrobacter sp.]